VHQVGDQTKVDNLVFLFISAKLVTVHC